MSSTFPNNNISVVIAYRGSDRHLLGTYNSLKMEFRDITIVGSNNGAISEEIKINGGTWVESESLNLCELWEKGIKAKNSSWYLLLEGREYCSTVLKESIGKTIKITPDKRTWFPLSRKTFFS